MLYAEFICHQHTRRIHQLRIAGQAEIETSLADKCNCSQYEMLGDEISMTCTSYALQMRRVDIRNNL